MRLTVKEKTPRKPEYGEVRWSVTVFNQEDEVAATYDLLTMNATAAHVPALETVSSSNVDVNLRMESSVAPSPER